MIKYGMPVVISNHIPWRDSHTDIPAVNFRYGKGHREWRRLVRERKKHARTRRVQDCYFMGGKVVMSQQAFEALNRHDVS